MLVLYLSKVEYPLLSVTVRVFHLDSLSNIVAKIEHKFSENSPVTRKLHDGRIPLKTKNTYPVGTFLVSSAPKKTLDTLGSLHNASELSLTFGVRGLRNPNDTVHLSLYLIKSSIAVLNIELRGIFDGAGVSLHVRGNAPKIIHVGQRPSGPTMVFI